MTDRRQFLVASSALFAGMGRADEVKKSPLGVVIHSFPLRSRDKDFSDPLAFMHFCHERGAAGVQVPLGMLTNKQSLEMRTEVEKHEMYVEGSVRPPKDKADIDRFDREINTARGCGATVVRTVMLGSRRYETFKVAKDFTTFAEQALASLRLAEPVVAKHKVTLAVENHKDFRTDELIGVMKAISSEHVGVCVDTGNSIALLERPTDTAEQLAPWVASCHLKDMGVEPAADGFLLAEVRLGEGFLDLAGIVKTLKKARPGLRLSLEMITRDPLRIPCLTDDYWATFDKVPGRDLARVLALVQKYTPKRPLQRPSQMTAPEQREVEDRNVRTCLEYGREKLGM